jgi:hypothetical protein
MPNWCTVDDEPPEQEEFEFYDSYLEVELKFTDCSRWDLQENGRSPLAAR